MEKISNQGDALDWITEKENRMLIIEMGFCKECDEWMLNEFIPWSKKQIDWEFATIEHGDWQIFADKFPTLAGSHIIPLGAPYPIEHLENLVRN